jgi:hypothetical protein
MANRSTYPLDTVKDSCHLVTAKLVGAGAADMTIPEDSSEIVSCTWQDTGTFAIVFRHSYPELKAIVGLNFGPRATDGLKAAFSDIDVTAKTATLEVEVNATDTDPASGDTLHIALLVRNSGRNG